MSKRLFCVKQGGRLLGDAGSQYCDTKAEAKVWRNAYQGEIPENKDVHTSWMYRVALGPDHWRSHA